MQKTLSEAEETPKKPKYNCQLTFLSTAEQSPVLLETEVHVDEISTRQELHNHSRGDNGRNTKFHKRSTVRGEDDAHPVERVGRVGRHDTVQGHLRANQENKQRNGCP